MNDLHLIASKVTITPVNCEADIRIISGINGRMTNSGSQHFQEGVRRVFDKRHIRMVQKTIQSDIFFVHHTTHTVECPGEVSSGFEMDRRRVYMIYDLHAGDGGLRMVNGRLRINPTLPRQVKSIIYPIIWKGNPIKVTVSKEGISIENRGGETVDITVLDKEYRMKPGRWDLHDQG